MYRGRWLNFCATDAQVEQFERKDELPLTMAEMADAIDEKYHAWRHCSERIDRRAAKIPKAGVIETATVYPACTSLKRIPSFWRFSRLVESVTYVLSTSLLVRSPPPLPTIFLIGRDLTNSRGGKRGQIRPLIRFRCVNLQRHG